MNKNSFIGLLIISAILIGFTFYNNKQAEKYNVEKRKLDSIERERIARDPSFKTLAEQQVQSTQNAQQPTQSKQPTRELESATKGKPEFYIIENDVIQVILTNKAGRVYEVRLKDYSRYGGDSLALFTGSKNDFSFTFFTNNSQNIETADFFFAPTGNTKHYALSENEEQYSFPLRLTVEDGKYVEYVYTIKKGSYMVDFDMNVVGMTNATHLDLLWTIDMPKQEKAFENENNYSTIAYRYPGENGSEDLGMGKGNKEETVRTKMDWIAFKQQFFSSILVGPKDGFLGAHMAYSTYDPNDINGRLKRCVARVQVPYDMNRDQTINMSFYFGPNKYRTLKSYDKEFQSLVPLGGWVIGWVNKWLVIPIFDFLGKYIGSYGLIILILTIIIKLLLFPLTFKSYLSSAKMRLLKPDVDKINQKYTKPDDAMKKQQETMSLYKKAGVSPMGGCLPMLIQFPILIAMFRFFPASIELRQQPFLWADDLSAYDSILQLPFNIPFYGDHVSLFTLLMAVALYVSSRMSMGQTADTGMPGMKFMTLYMMPIMLLVWFNNYSAGLSYYYLLSNIITIIQNFVTRRVVNDEKLHAKLKENSKKPVKKSKFQARLEQISRQQQQAQKQAPRKK